MSDHETPQPGERSTDETFDRLRASDPAADADIDLTAVRRALDARLDTRADESPVVPLRPAAAATGRWLRIAAVAAVVALVGSASFVVGRQSTGGSPVSVAAENGAGTTATSAVAIAPVPPRFGAPSTQLPQRESTEGATGPGVMAATDQKLVGGMYGRTHFNDGGLSTAGGSAEAWGFDASQVVSAATAERIAAAMGVPGTASVQYQAWFVGPPDGSGPTVSLMGDGTASINYNDPQAYPICVPVVSQPGPDGSVDGGVGGKPCAAAAPTDISGDDAITRTTDVMTRIGLDLGGYTLSSPDDQAGGGYRSVVAAQVLDGRETGVQFWFNFVGDRLASFYGGLAPLVSLGRYPVISPADAVIRMNDPRFGANSHPMPIDIMTTAVAPSEVPSAGVPAPGVLSDGVVTPGVPVPGAAISWPVSEVTLTSATLELTSQYQADGSSLLVPTYTMTDADGATWSVIAVADDQLDFTG
ncbi:MAG: hypothetical protein ABJA16_11540 [Nakamurella sp.]